MNLVSFFIVTITLLIPLQSRSAPANEAWNFYIENDARAVGGPGSDAGYSNGFKVSYIYAVDRIPKWDVFYDKVFHLFNINHDEAIINYGLSFGHQIYTPENTETSELIPNDRPYAGWLYLGFSSAVKFENVLHLWNFSFGLIGPVAQGEHVQTNYHKLIDTDLPKGWAHQLRNEPTLQLYYQQRYKWIHFSHKEMTWFRLLPYWGASLGNVLIDVNAGLVAVSGYQLGDYFGPARPSSAEVDGLVNPLDDKAEKFGFYFFVGAKGSAIARNLFLDGNTFEGSHRVTRIPLLAETEFGLGIRYRPFSAIWRYVTRGPEFMERTNSHSFASLSLQYQNEF